MFKEISGVGFAYKTIALFNCCHPCGSCLHSIPWQYLMSIKWGCVTFIAINRYIKEKKVSMTSLVVQGVSKVRSDYIVNCILRKAFNASLGKSKLIQVRNLSK